MEVDFRVEIAVVEELAVAAAVAVEMVETEIGVALTKGL